MQKTFNNLGEIVSEEEKSEGNNFNNTFNTLSQIIRPANISMSISSFNKDSEPSGK